eukprot:s2099_g1.t1
MGPSSILPVDDEVFAPLLFHLLGLVKCLAALVAQCVMGAEATPQTGVHFANKKTPQTSVLQQPSGQGLGTSIANAVVVEEKQFQTAIAIQAFCQNLGSTITDAVVFEPKLRQTAVALKALSQGLSSAVTDVVFLEPKAPETPVALEAFSQGLRTLVPNLVVSKVKPRRRAALKSLRH